MNKIIWLVMLTVLTLGSADAQSRKERKEMEKRQEIINQTTDPADGARWFMMDKKMLHIRVKVRDCYLSGTTVFVKLLLYNRESRDEVLVFDDAYIYDFGHDDEGNYIDESDVSFAIGDSERFEHNLDNVFIPGGLATLKVTMKIENVNPNISHFQDLKFGLKSTLSGGLKTYRNYIYDLKIRR